MEHLFALMLATGLRPAEARGLPVGQRQARRTSPGHRRSPAGPQKSCSDDSPRVGEHRRRPQVRVFGTPKSKHGRRTKSRSSRWPSRRCMHNSGVWLSTRCDTCRISCFRPRRVSRSSVARSPTISNGSAQRPASRAPRAHTLRHSTGTFLLAARQCLRRVVQAILGHGSAAMTRHYQHVLPSMLADARRAAGAVFRSHTVIRVAALIAAQGVSA